MTKRRAGVNVWLEFDLYPLETPEDSDEARGRAARVLADLYDWFDSLPKQTVIGENPTLAYQGTDVYVWSIEDEDGE